MDLGKKGFKVGRNEGRGNWWFYIVWKKNLSSTKNNNNNDFLLRLGTRQERHPCPLDLCIYVAMAAVNAMNRKSK